MSRSVPEWIGKTDDDAVPNRVRLRIWRRDANPEGFAICHISGNPIRPGDSFELDHKVPLILGGKHCESNLAFALTAWHRQKTATEVAARAESNAIAISHHGIGAVIETGLTGRTPAQKRAARDRKTAQANKLALPERRSLYAPIRADKQRSLPAPERFVSATEGRR